MTLRYVPATDYGHGPLVSVFKVAIHVWTVYIATQYEWAMTVEQARAEIEEAKRHLSKDTVSERHREFLAESTLDLIADWENGTNEVLKNLADVQAKDPEAPVTAEAVNAEALRNFFQQTWTLLAKLDVEMLGMPVADPGRLP